MAKTTATVTVGADTRPFDRKMKNLGSGGIGGRAGAMAGGLARRAGGAAMSGLGMGIGAVGAFAGLQGIGAIFQNMMVMSPKLAGAMAKLSVAFQQALLPAAEKLAEWLLENMPAIQSALGEFGTMLADAIQFWTEDALDPAIWKDIGAAIVDSVKDALNFSVDSAGDVGRGIGETVAGETGGDVGEFFVENMIPMVVVWRGISAGIEALQGNTEGGTSL